MKSHLRDGVGALAVGDGGRAGAVGLVGGNDLRGVGDVTANGVASRDAGSESKSSSEGLHFDWY